MKNKLYITILLALGLSSCSVETPFQGADYSGEGEFSKAALNLDVRLDNNVKVRTSSRAGEDLLDDFDIYFINTSTNQTAKYFSYKDMPEVITLPQGNYRVEAVYGEDLEAEWENPHFKGSSSNFSIEANKINTKIDPIICTLQNVMVSVIFEDELLKHITGEPEVEVSVNTGKSLTYKLDHSNNQIPGYFKHSEVCTLTATFRGVVDDMALTETKALDNIEAGNHYRLTFALHSYDANEKGEVDPEIFVDAFVTVQEVSQDIEVPEDEPLDDVTWPTEDPDDNPNIPNPPSDPNEPGESTGLTVILDPSITDSKFTLEAENFVDNNSKIALKIHSDEGLTEFRVKVNIVGIDLSTMGIPGNTLDFINPQESYREFINGIGIMGPEGQEKESLRGEKDVVFDLADFMTLLCMNKGKHTFDLHVADANGSKDITLRLTVN